MEILIFDPQREYQKLISRYLCLTYNINAAIHDSKSSHLGVKSKKKQIKREKKSRLRNLSHVEQAEHVVTNESAAAHMMEM
jgi:hypothetical protein